MRKNRAKLRLLTSTANSRTVEKEVRVEISRFAEKQMVKLPNYIKQQALDWVMLVKENGIKAAQIIPGYHDEPLHGVRTGQRSVRLNRSWRIFYTKAESENQTYITITVIEVNKHEY